MLVRDIEDSEDSMTFFAETEWILTNNSLTILGRHFVAPERDRTDLSPYLSGHMALTQQSLSLTSARAAIRTSRAPDST